MNTELKIDAVSNNTEPSLGSNTPKKRKKIYLILAVVFGAVAVIVTIFFVTRLSVQGWLDRFERGLVDIAKVQDGNGKPKSRDITRSIEIVDADGILQVEYEQRLRVFVDESETVNAYLFVQERYPSLQSDEFDILDEYYFVEDTMYTRRINGQDVFVTKFASTFDTIALLANENIGGASYKFRQEYFEPLESQNIVLHSKNSHILAARVKDNLYSGFFGGVDSGKMSEVTIRYKMDDRLQLVSFKLNYLDSGNSVDIGIASNTPKPIQRPDWAE